MFVWKAKVFFTLMALALILNACQQKNNKTPHLTDLNFPVTKVFLKDTVLKQDYITDIHAFRNVEIRARVQGYLENIYVDEGQEVKKGQRLFRINDEEYQSQYVQAKANLKSAIAEAKAMELELDRIKILVEKEVISKTELEVARAKLEAYNARIEEARSAQHNAFIKLSQTNIKAPFDGVIDRIPFKIGSLIDEGSLLTTVADINSIYAYFEVSEREYLEYVKKKLHHESNGRHTVELILADGSTHPFKGKIETMEGKFENTTGTIAFRALFPNPNKILKHGASGKVRLTTEVKGALIVPQKATLEIQDKTYVYVVDNNNMVTMKSFIPGTRISHFYIVNEGLKSGDRIIYEGIQNIREGMRIKPSYVPADSIILLSQQRAFSKPAKI